MRAMVGRLERGMQVTMKKFISFVITMIILVTQIISHAEAGNRFTSSYSCSDTGRVCVSGG